jgi:hypothetical protein
MTVVYVTRRQWRQRNLYPSHGFHLCMTVLTLGCWLPIWVAVTVIYALGRAARVIAEERAAYQYGTNNVAQLPTLHNAAWDEYYRTQPFYTPVEGYAAGQR